MKLTWGAPEMMNQKEYDECAALLDSIREKIFDDINKSSEGRILKTYSSNSEDIKSTALKRVRDFNAKDYVNLFAKLLYVDTWREESNPQLADFSDEDIIGEFNRRVEEGRIESNTRFYVSRKGTIN